MTKIHIPYAPRKLQAEIHEKVRQHRWSIIVSHRRFGKTVCAINHLLRDAILCEKPNPRFAFIAPTYRQAKNVAWDYLKQFAGAIPMTRFHETELRADLPNGARIQLLGSENPDTLRGIYLDGCVIDEMADCPESLFPEIIRPALSDRKGWCCFFGTPRGHNAFYDMYEAAQGQDDWFTALYRASDTKIVDAEELDAARAMMTADQFEQEFECSWVANVPGAIYGKILQESLEEKRICNVPYDPMCKVDTFWDLGIGDSTAIIFVQCVGKAVHIIDCYEARNEGLDHYVRVLDKKDYLYGRHYAPHDIEVRELGSGKSRREIAWDLGISFEVVKKLPLEDGIHAAQMLLPRCYFDQHRCKELLEALRQYHRAYDEKKRSFRASPVHDWSSHMADAWRYVAVGLNENRGYQQVPQKFADNNYNPLGVV